MKKVLLTLMIGALCITSQAQPISPVDIAAIRTLINTQFTTQTGFHAITHVIEGNMLDTMEAQIGILNAAITGSTGLQGALNAGNSATSAGGDVANFTLTNGISSVLNISPNLMEMSSSVYKSSHNVNRFQVADATGVYVSSLSIDAAYTGSLNLYDGVSGYTSTIIPNTLSANHQFQLPDEDGIGVTHITSTPVYVGVIGGVHSQYDADKMRLLSGGTPIISLLAGGLNPYLQMKDASSIYYSYFTTGPLTSTQNLTTIDASGSIPVVVSSANTTGNTAAIGSLPGFAFTPANDGTFEVSSYCSVTVTSGGNLNLYVNFKDENGTSRSIFINGYTTTGFYSGGVTVIRAKAGSPVTISTTLTGTATYDIGGTLKQIN